MCDYCSCRSMPAIDDLGADHEAITAAATRVRHAIAAGDHETAAAHFDRFLRMLHHHTDVEEASVFATLRAAGEMGEEVDALLAEHDAVWQSVADIDADRWDTTVLRLLDDLREHIAREEYDLFPATLLAFSPADWADVETAARRVRQRGG